MKLPPPSVPDLARLEGETRAEVEKSLKDFFEESGACFNYISGTRGIKYAHKGFHNLAQLVAGCDGEKTKQGKKSNKEIVRCAAPLAFARETRVFDLPRRKFPFGREFRSAFRIPFFFVEDRVVKLYYLQPRKNSGLNLDQLGMIATIHKRYLLDTEFFGQVSDLEYVDVSALPGETERSVRRYVLADLPMWSERRLGDRLTLIAEALEHLQNSGSVNPRKRRPAKPAADMPLF